MDLVRFFRHPQAAGQVQHEVLRASFLERLPAAAVAERFDVTPGNVHLLRHRFRRGLITFVFRPQDLPGARGTAPGVRARVVELRGSRNLSAGEIAEILAEEEIDISVRTVERILRRAGFPKLPRRARHRIGETPRSPRARSS